MGRIIWFIAGGAVIWIGYLVTQSKEGIRLRGSLYNPALGYGIICIGLVFIAISFVRTKGYFICPNCRKIDSWSNLKDNKCPECNNRVENLKGYFERHPDEKK